MKPEMITNDIITLLNEKKSKNLFSKIKKTFKNNSLHGAGDKKKGYEDPSYKTFSKSLESRKGRYSKSYEEFKHNNLGLPEQGGINSLTYLQINLGKKLFFDRRISLNDTISCAICHIPEQGFTSHELATPVGFEGRSLRRNAPTLYNVSFNKLFFHDGREYSLDNQVWSPLLKSNEMANPSIGYVIKKLKKLDDYNILFQKAYNGEEPNVSNIGHAFASYLKTLSSGNSPFDQWFYGKEENAITNKAKSGFKIFTGKGLCSTCHTIDQNHALFTDHKLHNTGLGFARSMGIHPFKNKLQVAPGVFITISKNLFNSLPRESVNDLGFYEVTQNPQDRWKYKTPTLRNITLTPPYMHDGSIGDLKTVIEFYNKGGIQNENLDPLIRPLGLSKNEKDNLLEFLKTLEGDNVEQLISDAFSQTIGER
jgi:cytochrome c peroxidase